MYFLGSFVLFVFFCGRFFDLSGIFDYLWNLEALLVRVAEIHSVWEGKPVLGKNHGKNNFMGF